MLQTYYIEKHGVHNYSKEYLYGIEIFPRYFLSYKLPQYDPITIHIRPSVSQKN
jgi:hypothetical protein